MGLENCPECGNLFVRVSRRICDDCFKEQEELLMRIQKFIKANPNLSIAEVAEANEVDEELIFQFIREKRLIISKGSGLQMKCTTCGKPIAVGRFCRDCQEELSSGLSPEAEEKEPARILSESPRRSEASDSQILGKFRKK